MKYIGLLLLLVLFISGCSSSTTNTNFSEENLTSEFSSKDEFSSEYETTSTENAETSMKNTEDSFSSATTVDSQTRVTMTIENQDYSVSLNESQAAKDFYEMLPLSLTLEDYNRTEKIANLPNQLDISDSPGGTSAKKGDISYYAPWGNLAIFYQDFGYGSGLVNLGRIDQGSEMLTNSGDSFKVTFSKAI